MGNSTASNAANTQGHVRALQCIETPISSLFAWFANIDAAPRLMLVEKDLEIEK
jgi:hypothetical protein